MSNVEAEQIVLGCFIKKAELVDDTKITSSFFHDEDKVHGLIFQILKWAREEDAPVNMVNSEGSFDFQLIASYYGDRLKSIGGVSYLLKLWQSSPNLSSFEYFENIVIQEHADHLKQEVTGKLIRDEIQVEEAMEELNEIKQMRENKKSEGPVLIKKLFEGHAKLVMKRSEMGGMVTGKRTMSKRVDDHTNGYQKGDLIIIAARPSIGKTQAMLNDALRSDDSCIFELEMPGYQLIDRIAGIISGIDSKKIQSGLLTDSDWERYSKALDVIKEKQVYIDDTPNQTLSYITSQSRKLAKKNPNITIYIDFLQLIAVEDKRMKDSDRVKHISQSLKQLARELNIPIVAVSAVGRGPEEKNDKRPLLSDLRESGSIESDADIVQFLYRDDYYYHDAPAPGLMEVIFAKGRNIGTGTIYVHFNKKNGRITDFDDDDLTTIKKKLVEYEQQKNKRR